MQDTQASHSRGQSAGYSRGLGITERRKTDGIFMLGWAFLRGRHGVLGVPCFLSPVSCFRLGFIHLLALLSFFRRLFLELFRLCVAFNTRMFFFFASFCLRAVGVGWALASWQSCLLVGRERTSGSFHMRLGIAVCQCLSLLC